MDSTERMVEFAVIAVYLVFLLLIGLAFRRFNSNISDFFRSGARGAWWLVGSSAFMAGISAYTFTGASGVAYTAGWSVAIIYIGNALGFFLAFLVFAPWFRQLRAITNPEVIRMRYGPFTQQFYAIFGVLTAVIGGGLQLWAMAIFTSAVFGFQIWQVIVVIGAVVVFYSTTGGSWAVMATDFVQSLIMIPLTVVIGVICLIEVGGMSGLNQLIGDAGLSREFRLINAQDDFPVYQFSIIWALAMLINQAGLTNTIATGQRYFMVKDGREARKAAFLAFVLMSMGSFFWFIPPMVARLRYEADVLVMGAQLNNPAEAAFAVASINLLPLGMTGMIVVAMFAATMSSMDSGINRNAAIFVRDIYPALCRMFAKARDRLLRRRLLKRDGHDDAFEAGRQSRRGPLSEVGLLLLGRVFSLIFGAIIILMALYFAQIGGRGMFDVMLDIAAMLGVPLSVPMLMGLFIKRVPGWSAMFAAICALIPAFLASEFLFGWGWNFQTKVFMNLSVGIVAYLATMPFWKTTTQDYRDQVTEFFTRMHTPVDFEKEIGQASDLSQLTLIGAFVCAVASFILLLLFLPNAWQGRLAIITVAGIVMGIGGLMIFIGRRGARKKRNKQN